MANSQFKPSGNFTPPTHGVTDDSNLTPTALRLDPTTKRLKVDATITSYTGVTDGEAVDAADTGTLILGTDGTNYQLVKTDSDGNLQVDIVSGAGGTEYTEGDTDASITGGAILWEDTGDTLRAVSAAKPLPISDAGGSLTIDGTVTADLGATDNAVLDAIAASVADVDTNTDGIEALLTTIDGDTSNLSVVGGGTEATAIRVTIANNSTGVLSIDDNSGSITVDATDLDIRDLTATDVVTANLSATDNAVLDTIDAVLDTINAKLVTGTVIGDVNLGATDNAVLDAIAASVSAIDTDATTIIGHVDGIEGLLTTIDADTGNIATSVANIDTDTSTIITHTSNSATSLAILDDWDNAASDGASVSGDVAHDTADAGEPVKVGMRAVAMKANPTEVAANDRTDWLAGVHGVPFVLGGHPNILSQNLTVTDADGAQTDTAIITAAANVAIVVTAIEVTADNANTGDVGCRIGFGTANTPAQDAAQVIMNHTGIAPGSGIVKGDGSGILGIGASNEDLRVTCEDPAGGNLSITVTYFTTDI